MTKRTIAYRKKYKAISFLSWLFAFGTAAFLIAVVFIKKGQGNANTGNSATFKEVIGTALYTFIFTNIPLVVLSILVKDKIKPVIWMANVIMANVIFGANAIYVVFALWLIDTYVLSYLKELYKDKYRINKEIDARG